MNDTILILKDLKRRVGEEAQSVYDVLDLIDEEIQMAESWEEIDKMSPEEIRTYLLANGYTEESLKTGLDKLLKMMNEHMTKRGNRT